MPELVGIVPCAGHATRLGALPLSKELLPILPHGGGVPRPVVSWLLEQFRTAGVRRAALVIRDGKWDIPAHLGGGSAFDLDLAYLVVRSSPSIPHSIARALGWAGSARVALGFPDMLLAPGDALAQLERAQRRRRADVALGLFPTDRPEKADLVETDASGGLRAIRVKPGGSRGGRTWALAVWSTAFSRFLLERLARPAGRRLRRELYPSDLFVAARRAGLAVDAVPLEGGRYLDLGTPEDLARAPRFLGE